MTLNDMKLSQKGLFLVSVPIVFELVLILVLLFVICPVQDSLESMSRSYSTANVVEQLANSFNLLDATIRDNLGPVNLPVEPAPKTASEARRQEMRRFKKAAEIWSERSPDHLAQFNKAEYSRWAAAAKRHLDEYTRLTAGDPKEHAKAEYFSDKTSKFFKLVSQAQGSIAGGDRAATRSYSIDAHMVIRELSSAAMNEITLVNLKQDELRHSASGMNEARLSALSQQVSVILILGAIANIVLAIILALIFSRTASARLLFLMDNTRRLSQGTQLNPALAGTDELAVLDKSFHEMAARLELSRQKEQAIIQKASDIMCSVDPDWTFAEVNPAARKIWGVEPLNLQGKSLEDLVSEKDWRSTKESLIRIKELNVPMTFENEVVAKNGRVVPMLWSARWNEEQGKMFCVVRDITERKHLERMKNEFVQMVSTDLRKPLAYLDNFLGAITGDRFGTLNKEGSDQARKSLRNNKRLLELVNDLLNLDKLSSGNLDLKIAECNAVDLVQRSIDAVQGFSSKMGIKLVNKAEDFSLDSDGDRIVQVLVNLIGNAVKFSPKGSEIICWCSREGDEVLFKVQDFGRGIPSAMCKSVFEKFKQVSKADATEKGGSGLGLAICKTIVECHGGEIGVDSEMGQGSTFWFRFPLKQKEAVANR